MNHDKLLLLWNTLRDQGRLHNDLDTVAVRAPESEQATHLRYYAKGLTKLDD